jgi:hypothetical protein
MIVVRTGASTFGAATPLEIQIEGRVIVDSSFRVAINARLEKRDIPVWCFSLWDEDYQGYSPAHHFAAGSTTVRDGRRMSINDELSDEIKIVNLHSPLSKERCHV